MEHFIDVVREVDDDFLLWRRTEDESLGLVLKLCDLRSQWTTLEIIQENVGMDQNIGVLCSLEKLPLNLALVTDLELLFVDFALLRMRFGHMASELLWSLELASTDGTLVQICLLVIQTLVKLFHLSLVRGERIITGLVRHFR